MKKAKNILNSLIENESALRKFLTGKVGCADTAADILQKVAEKLLRQERNLPVTKHRAYLYQTARNEVIDHCRFEEKRRLYESASAQISGELDYRDAERIETANDSLRILNDSLNELSYLTRQIFILYRIDGIKQATIAKRLGLNLSTVEKRLAFAMKHCRARMKEKEIYGIAVSQTSIKKER